MTTDLPKPAQLRTLPRNFCPLQDPRLDKPCEVNRSIMEAEGAAQIAPVTATAAMEVAMEAPAAGAQLTSSHLTLLSASRLKISISSSRLTLLFSTRLGVACSSASSRKSMLLNRLPLLPLKPSPNPPQRLVKTRFLPRALSMSCSISCLM